MYLHLCVQLSKYLCMYAYRGTVAYWLERSACNVESTGWSLVRDRNCVGIWSKLFALFDKYCLCMYICTIYIYINISIYRHARISVCIGMFVYSTCVHSCMDTHRHTYRTPKHTHTHLLAHAHTHTHTHTDTQWSSV